MCGVVGLFGAGGPEDLAAFAALMRESRVRGMHAYGIAWHARDGRCGVHKALDLDEALAELRVGALPPPTLVLGHCRYSTSGDWREHANNQPIVLSARALVFNGVIHQGTRAEFSAAFGVPCATDNDGEVFLRLLERGESPEAALARISGSFAGAWLEPGRALALRNARRPLWRAKLPSGATVLASTADILARAGTFADPAPLEPGRLYAWDA